MSDGTITVYHATPLQVRNDGDTRMSGGTVLVKWRVNMDDGCEGIFWGSEKQPCAFTASVPCTYTRTQKTYGIKIMPYVVSVEQDKEHRITRMAALNTANGLIANGRGEATIENLTGIADKLLEWINQQQPQTPNK